MKYPLVSSFLIAFLLIPKYAFSQVGVAVNATGSAPISGTMLDITSANNTSSTYGIRVNTNQFSVRGDGNVGVGILPQNDIRLITESSSLGSALNDISIVQQWSTNVGNYQYLRAYSRRGAAGSSWTTSDLYIQRYVDADANAMGFIKWSGGDWGLEFGSGSSSFMKVASNGRVGIGTMNPQAALHVSSNGGVVNIEGVDHSYIQWYPIGIGSGRRAYTGFPGSGSTNFVVANEISGGIIDLSTNSGAVRVNSLAGGGTKEVFADNNGILTTTGTIKKTMITAHSYNDNTDRQAVEISWFPSAGGEGEDDYIQSNYSTVGWRIGQNSIAPYNGRLVKIVVRTSAANSNVGNLGGRAFNCKLVLDVNGTVLMTNGLLGGYSNTTFVYDIPNSDNFTFLQGDKLGIGFLLGNSSAASIAAGCVNCRRNSGNYLIQLYWEYEVPQ